MRNLKAALIHTTFLAVGAAAQALVVDGHTSSLLGAWANGRWLDSAAAAKLAKPGDKYRAATPERALPEALVSGAPKAIEGECGDSWEVQLAGLPEEAIAVSGDQANFAAPSIQSANNRAQASFRSLLNHHGIRAEVKIDQLWQADIDNDGSVETIASFYNAGRPGTTNNQQGDYSLIAVRFLDGEGKQRTLVPVMERYTKGGEDISRLRLGPLVDINGDGKLEIVIRGSYSRGEFTHVYEYSNSKLNRVLECTCGG